MATNYDSDMQDEPMNLAVNKDKGGDKDINMFVDSSIKTRQNRKCLVDFQEKKCNALKLDGDCSRLYSCVQKEKEDGAIVKSWSLVTISINEVKESALYPVVIVMMLLVFQIAKSVSKREEMEVEHRFD